MRSLIISLLLICVSIPAYAQSSNIWAVSVGIGTYRYPTKLSALQGPVSQAYEFVRVMERRGFTNNEEVPILTNAQATRPAILRTLESTFVDNPAIGPNDLIIFYYSGHGIAINNKIGLCPFDYYDQQQLIEDQTIIDIMKRSPAKHKICLIEACKSESRTAAPSLSQSQLNRFNQRRNQIRGGLVYLTSTKAGQPSYEPPDIGGGVFSHYLIRAIKGEADLNRNYTISSSELYTYLKEEVSRHTKRVQVPQINVEGLQLDVPIFELPKPKQDIPEGFVRIDGGTFQMGDQFEEGRDIEQPVHSVSLSPFLLATHELTFNEYDLFCESTGRDKPDDEGWGRDRLPVINISWYDAIEYCNWRSQQEGLEAYYTINKSRKDPNNNNNSSDNLKWLIMTNDQANGYRLPTEAEWEYAARQRGQKVRFGNGQDIADPEQINFDASESYKKTYSKVGTYRGKTVEVGSFSPNGLDLYDMSGNVWEWCWDWIASDYYEQGNNQNPQGATAGSLRVVRGGSWDDVPYLCRAADRSWSYPNFRINSFGVRLARHITL
ncbi:MAG: SUMF1/EgtB/PvdO family nonheme iron enzyme [Bacteroidota bacterium]